MPRHTSDPGRPPRVLQFADAHFVVADFTDGDLQHIGNRIGLYSLEIGHCIGSAFRNVLRHQAPLHATGLRFERPAAESLGHETGEGLRQFRQ